jgi:hydrogenase accessory protein HypB
MADVRQIKIDQKIQEANNQIAERIRTKRHKINLPMVDIMGSVGSGKTSILEFSTCIQINTGRGCHLMAFQVEKALEEVNLEDFAIIFVENVGNLICPSTTDIGADKKITVTSVTEGPYVFQKHPVTFKLSQLAVINKIDLAPAMEIDVRTLIDNANRIYPHLEILPTSAKIGTGMDELAKKMGLESL